jgi:hypothetical protein
LASPVSCLRRAHLRGNMRPSREPCSRPFTQHRRCQRANKEAAAICLAAGPMPRDHWHQRGRKPTTRTTRTNATPQAASRAAASCRSRQQEPSGCDSSSSGVTPERGSRSGPGRALCSFGSAVIADEAVSLLIHTWQPDAPHDVLKEAWPCNKWYHAAFTSPVRRCSVTSAGARRRFPPLTSVPVVRASCEMAFSSGIWSKSMTNSWPSQRAGSVGLAAANEATAKAGAACGGIGLGVDVMRPGSKKRGDVRTTTARSPQPLTSPTFKCHDVRPAAPAGAPPCGAAVAQPAACWPAS